MTWCARAAFVIGVLPVLGAAAGSCTHAAPVAGHARVRVVLAGLTSFAGAYVAVPAGRYDLTLTGVANKPVTTLTVTFNPSAGGPVAAQVQVDLDFFQLDADRGDVASGALNNVLLESGVQTDVTIPVQWSGGLIGTAARFPLSVSAAGRYLEDANGEPFLLHGDAPWGLIAALTLEEAETYLHDRQGRGVQAILVRLLEHQFVDDPPNNAYGEPPFLVPGDFTTPNEAYFAHADAVLRLARDHGMAVLLAHAYAGYQGGSEGFWAEMSSQAPEQCGEYGQFLGERYGDLGNIIWVSGGDFLMPVGTDGEACALAIRDGILATDTDGLHTVHNARYSTSVDQPSFADSVDVNGVYANVVMYPAVREAWQANGLPIYMLEGRYENEHSATTADVRSQSWWAMTSGATGQIAGNRPIWLFDPGWEEALNSELSRDLGHMRVAFDGWAWWRLEPDLVGTFLVAGAGSYGSSSYATAALGNDGSLAVVYLPPAGGSTRTITLDLTQLSGTASASWLDPTNGEVTAAGVFAPAGTQNFTAPGINSAGEHDWVLALEVE